MESLILPLVTAGLAFLSILLFSVGVMSWINESGKMGRLQDRLDGAGAGKSAGRRNPFAEMFALVRARCSRILTRLGEKLGPKDGEEASESRLALIRAGIRSPNAPLVFQGIKGGLLIILLGSFAAVRYWICTDLALHWTLFSGVFAAAAGCYLPDLWLRSRTGKRRTAILNELPDALDLLVVCVESGMGLDQAIHRVSYETRHSGPIMSWELQLLTLELRAGKRRHEALRALAHRVGLEDLNSLVTLLIQADIFGISIARTLRVYSETMRGKRFQRAEEAAAKLPVKLLIPLIVCILPALFVAIMGPAAINLMGVFKTING